MGYLGLLPRPALVHLAQGQTFATLLSSFISRTKDISGALLEEFQQLQANISVIPLPTSSAEFWACAEGVTSQALGMQRRSLHLCCASLQKQPQRGQGVTLDPARLQEGMLCEGRVGITAKAPESTAGSGKTRKAVADEPVPAPFSGESLRISKVKQFKTDFNYLSSTSIMQFSQGTVIQPILLSHSLLPLSPESFSFILPSVSSHLSLLFPQEWKFPEDCDLWELHSQEFKATLHPLKSSTGEF